VKRSNLRYLFIDDLDSGGPVECQVVIYGGKKFVSKNVSKTIMV